MLRIERNPTPPRSMPVCVYRLKWARAATLLLGNETETGSEAARLFYLYDYLILFAAVDDARGLYTNRQGGEDGILVFQNRYIGCGALLVL